MLVLSRNKNEKILIGEDIFVMVIAVDGHGTVKLGVEAPKGVEVDREEVRIAKRKNASPTS